MTDGKGQAPDPETDPGPAGFIGAGRRAGHGARRGHASWASRAVRAAFAAMSVRCWEPSRRMRATER
ncbi:hypothetical protein SGRIM128S_03921 [Streptomyces griseomycini]